MIFPKVIRTTRNEDEPDDRKRKFIISSEKRDRHGTIIPLKSWSFDNFRKAPGVYFMHKTSEPWFEDGHLDIDWLLGTGEIETDNKYVYGTTYFEGLETTDNIIAEKALKKIDFGSLRATSVGFIPYKGHWGLESDNEDTGTYYFDNVELTEYSHVFIGSNPEAIKKSFDGGIRSFIQHETGKQGEEVIEEIIAKENELRGLSYHRATYHFLTLKQPNLWNV